MSALRQIRNLDYTVIFARDMKSMRNFYENVLKFPINNELGPQWIAYRVGSCILALTERGLIFNDEPTPAGALSLQLAFRVPPAAVDACAKELEAAGVKIELPPTDQPWGHRTLFFRDPDGNVLEIYADI
jgi:lactoylglutathione lyase